MLPRILKKHKSRCNWSNPRNSLHLHQNQRENGEPNEHGRQHQHEPPGQASEGVSIEDRIFDRFHDGLKRFENEGDLIEIVGIEVNEA